MTKNEMLSSVASTAEILADFRAGKMVILIDDEDRENEGDLLIAADFVTPEAINFMARHARGLVCLTLTEERCRRLRLPLMTAVNGTKMSTNFTMSIEAAEGVTTGISAADRARTIQAAVAADAKPSDIVQPGHVFPVMARPGGVLTRAGHTEAGCDLGALTGLTPSAVICEIMKEDGTMAANTWLQVDPETWYLFGTDGYMIFGWWQNSRGQWYYMNKDLQGKMQIGWLLKDQEWYYMDKTGAMQTGFQVINGKKYYFDGQGKMLKNTTVEGVVLGADGAAA